MKKNYNIKKTISIKHFISEFGENFSSHLRDRLLDLEIRCVLVRHEEPNVLDLVHVEHTKYPCVEKGSLAVSSKEYKYATFIVQEENLYLSECSTDTSTTMESPTSKIIYDSLSLENSIRYNEINAKVIDDKNIDFVIDKILGSCSDVSDAYKKIVGGMLSRSEK